MQSALNLKKSSPFATQSLGVFRLYPSGSLSRFRTAAIAAAVITLLGACSDVTPPASAPIGTAVVRSTTAADAELSRGLDAEFLEIEASIPGFAGIALAATGDVDIHLRDLDRADAAVAAVRARLTTSLAGAHTPEGRTRQLRVRQADYAFSQLVGWKYALRQVIRAGDGVIGLDADEANNRVTLHVVAGVETTKVVSLASQAGVPWHAIRLVTMDSVPTFQTSLTDRVRPLGAGLKIVAGWYERECTAGPIVHWGNAPAILTASHCFTNASGGIDGKAPASQNAVGSRIGMSLARQTPWTQTGCTTATWCRDHDVAVIALDDTVSFLKRVAESQTWGTGTSWGNTTLQTWWTVSSAGSSYYGATVYKTGYVTGTTYGQITATCVDKAFTFPALGSATYEVRCLNEVSGSSAPGDSGSPVYAVTWDGYAGVTGVVTGGDNNGHFYYNDWTVFESHLGTLIAY